VSAEPRFFSGVEELRTTLGISQGRGGEKDRKRIALAVTDAFLRVGGDINAVPFLEWQIYMATAGLGLVCGPTAEELRCEENRALRDWDPLKMHPKPADKDCQPCALVNRIVTVLLKGKSNADRNAKLERIRERREPHKTLGDYPHCVADLD